MRRKRIGSYFLDQETIGHGQSAAVYVARHSRTNQIVALKLFHLFAPEEAVQKQFLREIKMLKRLSHPKIVSILEAAFDHDNPYYTMYYAPGGNLRKMFPEGTRLVPDEVNGYVQEIAEALQHAHDHGIVHCDLKPENILIGDDGHILLADFGIARSIQTIQAQSTQGPAGTARYMAPEQFRGRPGKESDQYALAILTYELLAGKPPFPGNDMPSLSTHHLFDLPPSLTALCPAVSSKLEAVIFQALAKEPTARYPMVRGFAQAFQQAIQQPAVVEDMTVPHPMLQPTEEAEKPIAAIYLHESTVSRYKQMKAERDEAKSLEDVPIDFAFITILPKERDALLKHLRFLEEAGYDSLGSFTYSRGRIELPRPNEYYEVVFTTPLEMGNTAAALGAMALIERWHPKNILTVGIASGVPERAASGDIVVAEYLLSHQFAKDGLGDALSQETSLGSDRLLYERTRAFAEYEWKKQWERGIPSGLDMTVRFGNIVSGANVVTDKKALRQLIQQHPDVLAVSMEGAGVVDAIHRQFSPPRFLEIRGICDDGDSEEHDAWQLLAAEMAALFTIKFLQSRPVPPLNAPSSEYTS